MQAGKYVLRSQDLEIALRWGKGPITWKTVAFQSPRPRD
jgi:hypothetical protein